MKTFEKVYKLISRIPKGYVMTYGQIAKILDINPRVVGFALRTNKRPDLTPCHRIVSKEGKLTGYAFGGIVKKKEILQKEGITFVDEETVSLKKHLYTISVTIQQS